MGLLDTPRAKGLLQDFVTGVSRLPYRAVGAPVDLMTALMRPAGYNEAAPIMGSDWLINKAAQAGIARPPTGTVAELAGDVVSGLLDPSPSTEAVLASKAAGLLGGMTKGGLLHAITTIGGVRVPRDEAEMLARQNAVRMLGLPEGNTAADRAAAMGYTTPAYHGSVGDIEQFNPAYRGVVTNAPSAKKADFAASSPLVASGYSLAPEGRSAIELKRAIAEAERIRNFDEAERLTLELENFVYGGRNNIGRLSDERFAADQQFGDVLKKYGTWQDYYSFRPEYGDHTELGAFHARRRMRESAYNTAIERLPKVKDEKAIIRQMEEIVGAPFAFGWNTADDPIRYGQLLSKKNPELGAVYRSMIDGTFNNPPDPAALRELEDAYQRIRSIDAEWLAEGVPEGANVMPLLLNTNGFATKDFRGLHYRDESYNELIKRAKKNKKPGIVMRNTFDPGSREMSEMTDVFAIIDPSRIRSRFAVFDPARAQENDIMGGATPAFLGLLGLGTAGGIGAWTLSERSKARE